MATGAKEVLNDIIKDIQESNLNFSMNITPFSAYITLRSSFTKNFLLPAKHHRTSTFPKNVKAENHSLIEENEKLLEKLKTLEETNLRSTATIKVLTEKISNLRLLHPNLMKKNARK